MSQVKLAALTNRSESWVSQVERGARPVERIGVIAELARALDVPVTELTGTSPPAASAKVERHPATDSIRLLLSEFDFLALLLNPRPSGSRGPTDVEQLRADTETLWVLTHESRYDELVPLLREVLPRCQEAARSTEGAFQDQAFELLAIAYQAAAAVMAKLGETDVAWVAADRSIMAAERSGVPLLAFAGVFRLAHGFLAGWKLDQAERAAASAALALASRVAEGRVEEAALYGALNLVRAVAASRAGRGSAAWEAIAEAERAAKMTGEGRNDFDTEFGPTNVALHGVAAAVELGEAGDALRRAVDVEAGSLSLERRARFVIDVARAHGQRRQSSKAITTLRDAYSIDAEQVRHNPLVRELVRDLMRRDRRRPDPELISLAQSIGVV